jgi:tetratricopeptide (TPR) repeat protein
MLRDRTASPYRSEAASGGRSDAASAGLDAPHTRYAVLRLITTKAMALNRLARYETAESTLRDAMLLFPHGISTSESLFLMRARGWIAYREGRLALAERLFGDTADGAAQRPTLRGLTLSARVGLGATYLDLGAVDEAAGVAKQMLSDAPSNPAGMVLRASAELARGQMADAALWARQACACAKIGQLAEAEALRVVAEVELAADRIETAILSAESAVEMLDRLVGETDMFLSEALVTLARAESARAKACAEQRFAQALALSMPDDHPRRRPILLAFAEALVRDGRDSEAEDLRLRAAAIPATR